MSFFKPVVVVLLFSLLILELASWFALDNWSSQLIQSRGQSSPFDPQLFDSTLARGQRIPHPYFGHITRNLSFETPKTYFEKDPEHFHVALFGGSVAQSLYDDQESKLKLESPKYFPGKPAIVHNFADGGYKQPQSFFISSVYRSSFDVAINVEGYNELTQGSTRHPPYYPMLSVSGLFFESGNLSKNILDLASRRAALRLSLDRSPSSFPASLRVIRKLYYHHLTSRLHRATGQLVELQLQSNRWKLPDERLFRERLNIWLENSCSQQNHLRAGKIPYFSFVQPLPFTKSNPTSGESARMEFFQKHSHNWKLWQDLLLSVNFSHIRNMTGLKIFNRLNLFEKQTGEIYTDGCCHLNGEGRLALAKNIAETVQRELDSGSLPSCDWEKLKQILQNLESSDES